MQYNFRRACHIVSFSEWGYSVPATQNIVREAGYSAVKPARCQTRINMAITDYDELGETFVY